MSKYVVSITFDWVGGGWHPNDTFTERIEVIAKDETTAETAAVRRFGSDYYPTARIKSVSVSHT